VDADGQQSSSVWLKEIGLSYQVISNPETLFESLPQEILGLSGATTGKD